MLIGIKIIPTSYSIYIYIFFNSNQLKNTQNISQKKKKEHTKLCIGYYIFALKARVLMKQHLIITLPKKKKSSLFYYN